MLVLVLFKDQVVMVSCAVQERKAMPASQGKSCAAFPHLHANRKQKYTSYLEQNQALVTHSTSRRCSVGILLKESFIWPRNKSPKQFRGTNGQTSKLTSTAAHSLDSELSTV